MSLSTQKKTPLFLPVLLLLGALAACSNSEDPAKPTAPVGPVGDYMTALPDWDTYSPLGTPAPAAPTDEPADAGTEVVDVEVIDDQGGTSILTDVNYICRETPYRLTENPSDLVMFDPDRPILWPGAMIQGDSYRLKQKRKAGLLPKTK